MNAQVPDLVIGFADGNDADFAKLVRMFRRKVYSAAFRLLGNHLDADEVVQETFVRIHRKRGELRRIKYFSTFVMRVATNYSIDLIRRRKGQSSIEDGIVSLPGEVQLDLAKQVNTPSQEYENKQIMQEIRIALDKLPPKQRLTAILHDVEGYTKPEVARIMECPEATVRSNLHIARTKLKRILKHRL
jgi:RNA polymerase sigma-70 factor (ECF subfamily)